MTNISKDEPCTETQEDQKSASSRLAHASSNRVSHCLFICDRIPLRLKESGKFTSRPANRSASSLPDQQTIRQVHLQTSKQSGKFTSRPANRPASSLPDQQTVRQVHFQTSKQAGKFTSRPANSSHVSGFQVSRRPSSVGKLHPYLAPTSDAEQISEKNVCLLCRPRLLRELAESRSLPCSLCSSIQSTHRHRQSGTSSVSSNPPAPLQHGRPVNTLQPGP